MNTRRSIAAAAPDAKLKTIKSAPLRGISCLDLMVTLLVPTGAETAPISHGHECFVPYRANIFDPTSPYLVDVPVHAVDPFCLRGGFQVLDQPMRRRLSGQVVPLILRDGSVPSSVTYDGDVYASQLIRFPDGSERHLIAFPEEGLGEFLQVHPGYTLLSMADHSEAETPPVHPGESYELAEWYRELQLKNPLQGGGFYHLDLFPSDSQAAAHPDGVPDPLRVVAAQREAAKEAERRAVARAERAERLLAEAEERERALHAPDEPADADAEGHPEGQPAEGATEEHHEEPAAQG